MKKFACALALAMTVATPALAADGFGDKIGEAGGWTIYTQTDPMTDAKQCVALFEDRDDVQYSGRSFAISLRGRGGIRAYTMRLDQNEALPMQLADEDERSVQAVYLTGDGLDQIKAAARLRIEVLTVLRDAVFEDIDLSPLTEVDDTFASAGCAA